ncbi:right-handed parallel beta-helix repeat-containing protein [Desulforhopalus sp. 52FAK]
MLNYFKILPLSDLRYLFFILFISAGYGHADFALGEDIRSAVGRGSGSDTNIYEEICAQRAYANCYYVSNSGNYPDSTEGKHLFIEDISTHSFAPGDIILFRRGDVWRQETTDSIVTLTSSGTEESYIILSAFGSGANPAFLGSIKATSWFNISGNIWGSGTNIPIDPNTINYGAELFFEDAQGSAFFGHRENSTTGFDRAGDWTWSNNRVYIYSTEDPNSSYASIEVPQAQRLIRLNNQQYVGIDSISLKYMVNAGIYDNYGNAAGLKGLQITNCEIGYIGVKNSGSAYGISLERSEVYIRRNTIHDCGRRSISLVLYNTDPSVIEDVIIESNHFFNGYHTTGVDIQSNTARSGSHLIQNITIRGNLFEGDPNYDIQGEDGSASNHIFINQDDNSILKNIFIHNNIFTYAHGSSIKTSSGDGYYIYNNTFYGFNHSYDNYQAHIFGGNDSTNTIIKNNIFFSDATNSRYACIEIGYNRHSHYQIDNNLYFNAAYSDARLLWVDRGTSYFFDDDWGDYTSVTGFDRHSPKPADPLFVGATWDFRPTQTSPVLGEGEVINWISKDYLGNPINNPPDLGAIQDHISRPSYIPAIFNLLLQ